MDIGSIVAGILAINLSVFLGGCALATYRTWRESHPVARRSAPRGLSVQRPIR